MANVKYYNLGEESDYEVINYDNKDIIIKNKSKLKKEDEEYSRTVNFGISNLLKKDMDDLSYKVNLINKKIIKNLALNEIVLEEKLDYNIENINEIITNIENIISGVIIKKNSIKINIFSTRKKEKKEKQESLSSLVEVLTKCQNDLIALKDEYNKLQERKDKVNK